ncbi:oxidoreductase-like domain-containing protein [Sphingomonas sp. ID0503]|uniref:oxidoreductase-like domain-containing protein n=1 Tax=Sphingomonas sp. ID0503 TaxID=3399691 RepID=UPI003AFB4500
MNPPPKPPVKPEDWECCHRGCCPCIFDYYWDALERWQAAMRERGLDPVLPGTPPSL